MRNPETIAFVSIEDEEPDLLLSFALEPGGSRSITLLRTPPYEVVLPEEERGVAVMSGAHDVERELLVSIAISAELVSIESQVRTYRLSASSVSPEDIAEVVAMLRRMNFDNRFVINAA